MVLSLKKWIVAFITMALVFPLFADTSLDDARTSLAKGIRGNLLNDRKSAIISWEPPKEEGEIIIARSNSVIDSPEKLYIADSLGRYKSGGANGTRNYYDYNLKPGTYYYAVALVSDVRKREVKLIANQNYTQIPVKIDDNGDTPEVGVNPLFPALDNSQSEGLSVTDIRASLERKNVRIDWTPPNGATSGRTIYTIYRSTSPLTTLPLMQKAIKLAEVSHPTHTFLDQGLERSQTLFYGVSVKEGTGPETIPLFDKVSTLRIFYVKDSNSGNAEVIADDTPAKTEATKPTAIPVDAPGTMHVRGVGYERVGRGVVMSWLPPDGADESVVYSVYASTKPLNQGASSFGAGTVVKVATIEHPKTNFFIKELKEMESLYFGITAKSNAVSEDFNLKENVSYFRYDFGKDLSVPSNTEVAETTPNKQDLASKIDEPNLNQKNDLIPADLRPLTEDESLRFDDPNSNHSTVGYNLSEEDLNRIIRETVLRKKYETGIFRLEQYLAQEKNSHLQGKAYFYLAVSYLKSGENRKALRYLMKRETKSFSPERTEFWTNQTLEKMGRGKL
jgi:hypothetical protein